MILYTSTREHKTTVINDEAGKSWEHIFVREVGHSLPKAGIRLRMEGRDVWTAHFAVSGSCGFNDIVIHAGEGCLIPPGVGFEILTGEGLEHYWMMFGGGDIPEILSRSGIGREANGFSCGFFERVRGDFDAIVSAEPTGEFDLEMYMNSLFWKLMAYHREGAPERSSPADGYIRLARSFVDSHFSEPIGVEDIAAAAHVTSRYMYKLFKKRLGRSPKEYLTDRRMECARYLLSTTGLSVSEISADVGFGNPSGFAAAFREKHGAPPEKWRLGLRSGEKNPESR